MGRDKNKAERREDIKTYFLRKSTSKQSKQVPTSHSSDNTASQTTSKQAVEEAGDPNAKQAMTDEQGTDNNMEARILEAIGRLDTKTDEMKCELNARLDKIEETLKENTGKIKDLEQSVEFAHGKIITLTEKMQTLESENKKLKQQDIEELGQFSSLKDTVFTL